RTHTSPSHFRFRANRTLSRHRRMTESDLACVKTHTFAKCRKNNSPSRHRTWWCAVSSTLEYAIPSKCFYVCGECWSFDTAKTRLGHRTPNLLRCTAKPVMW